MEANHMAGPTKGFVFLTYATKRFIPSLQIWLKFMRMHLKGLPGSKAIVWMGADIDDAAAADLRMAWPEFGFLSVPRDPPANSFADYWAAEHYAWKLWILKHTCTDKERIYIYMDAGVVMSRMPVVMIEKALSNGLCLVEDTTQKNRYWFSEEFSKELAVQDYERDANQVQAATIVCTGAGGPILDEAYALSRRRSIIAGPKWAGMTAEGQPFGHRHDQAILSLLRIRHNIPTVMIEKAQCMHSLKETSGLELPFYIHRGAFAMTKDIMPLISEVAVINLPRRKDRLDLFVANHPELVNKMQVHAAVDGRSLKLTPAIARTLRPNDFFWKKAVAGCALSHLGLWHKLATAGPDINSMLILEDDAKLVPGWADAWNKAAPTVPADWDVLYLGGVLPPNLPALESVKERVAGSWCRIAQNQIFGQREPTRYFHYCAYAYVLSKAGAKKIMKLIEGRDGFFTSADHIMCNHHQDLNLYFLDPKLAGCTQEADPVYQKSQFNDFSRVDGFDSDLWNNDERWTLAEREESLATSGSLDVRQALLDTTEQTDDIIRTLRVKGEETKPAILERNLLVRMMGAGPNEKNNIMEIEWLENILDCKIYVEPMVQTNAEFKEHEVPWVIVSRQDLEKWMPIFRTFEGEKRPFYVIHLSDEFGKDDISWYAQKSCLGIIRTYSRPDATSPKVITLPLGYARGAQAQATTTQKTLAWSFEGTNWFGRAEALAALESVQPYEKRLYDGWAHPEQKTRAEYAAQIARSEFVPCMRGNHFETFRIYEALEAGSVPIYVRNEGDDVFWSFISAKLPLMNIKSWADAAKYMTFFRANESYKVKYRDGLLNAWADWKKELRSRCAKII